MATAPDPPFSPPGWERLLALILAAGAMVAAPFLAVAVLAVLLADLDRGGFGVDDVVFGCLEVDAGRYVLEKDFPILAIEVTGIAATFGAVVVLWLALGRAFRRTPRRRLAYAAMAEMVLLIVWNLLDGWGAASCILSH